VACSAAAEDEPASVETRVGLLEEKFDSFSKSVKTIEKNMAALVAGEASTPASSNVVAGKAPEHMRPSKKKNAAPQEAEDKADVPPEIASQAQAAGMSDTQIRAPAPLLKTNQKGLVGEVRPLPKRNAPANQWKKVKTSSALFRPLQIPWRRA